MTTPLIRGIGRWGLMGLLINLFIGAGIFGLPSRAFELTNAYSLFAFAGCGFLIALIITCFVEVGSRYPLTGGPYVYASKTFGPVIGYQVGWLMWLTRVTSFAAIANILLSYLAVFLPLVSSPGGRVATITIVVLVLSYVNYIGVHQTARLSSWLAVAKLVPLLLFVAIGAFFVEPQNFDFQNVPSNESFALAVMLLVGLAAAATSQAAKPRDPSGEFIGNGFPSGPHFNLILNAKANHFRCPGPEFFVLEDNNLDADAGMIVDFCDPGDVCEEILGNVAFLPREQGTDPISLLLESGRQRPQERTW